MPVQQNTRSTLKSFPTPNIKDAFLVEVREVNGPDGTYPLPYGTVHPNVRLFPGYKLVLQAPAEPKVGWITRTYAAPRESQDEYNYTETFSADADDYPIYVRAYVYLRLGYLPAVKLTPDPMFPVGPSGSPVILVEEEMREVQEPELKSLYIMVLRSYESVPGPEVISKKLADTPLGLVNATEIKQRVAYGTTVAPAYGKLAEEVESDSTTKANKTSITVDGATYPTLVTYDYDGQLDVVVTTTRFMVPAGTTYTKIPGDLEQRDIPQNQDETLRIVSHVDPASLPTRTEYSTVDYTFPALLSSIEVDLVDFGSPATEAVQVRPVLRPSVTVATQITTVTTFSTTEPAPVPVFQLVPNNLIFRGITYSIAISNVLNDDISLSVSGFSTNQYLGLTDAVSFGASVPSMSAYTAEIGTSVVIGCDIKFYRGGIWIKRISTLVLV